MNLRALLELCRISNLPTVWSNVIVGFYAGYSLAYIAPEDGSPQNFSASQFLDSLARHPAAFVLLIVMLVLPYSCLYVAGMVQNDLVDCKIDSRERPSRPIPSGRVSEKLAARITITFFILGIAGIAVLDLLNGWRAETPWLATFFGLVLLIAITLYNHTHQRSLYSVVAMGCCRGLIVLSAASLQQPTLWTERWWFFVIGPAITLLIYTVLISIVARNEMQTRWFGGPKTIMNMIAGMPLLDAVWLVVMGLWPASLFCVGCSVLTKLGHRKVAGS